MKESEVQESPLQDPRSRNSKCVREISGAPTHSTGMPRSQMEVPAGIGSFPWNISSE